MPRLFGGSPSRQQQKPPVATTTTEKPQHRSSFSFVKSTPRTSSSMLRSREHAKQIAIQLSEQSPAPTFVDFQPFPLATTTDNSPDSGYNMNAVVNQQPQNRRLWTSQPVSLDLFVEEHEQQSPPVLDSDTHSLSTAGEPTAVNSMPTFPSNSTMQSKNVIRNSSSQSTGSGGGGGAAARRRMRAQQKTPRSDSGGFVVDASYEALEDHHQHSISSPYPLIKSGSAKANHLLNYAVTPRGPIEDYTPTSNRSTNSAKSSRSSFSSAEFAEFGNSAGFSFDAFGLDEQEVDQEVKLALQDLVQGSHPNLGFFLDEEFPVQNFDSSSRSTPTSEGDGYVDGFRVTAIRQSPASSDRSSLTSTSEYNAATGAGVGVNRFKVQAGFHKSKSVVEQQSSSNDNWASFERGGRPPVSPGPPIQSSSPHHHYYARSESAGQPQSFPIMPDLVEEYARGETGFDDGEQESDDDNYGVKSEFQEKSEAGAPSDVGARSDVGVMMAAFDDDARLDDVGSRSEVGGATSDADAPRSDVVGARSDVGVASDVGARSDVALASDVGVASEVGVGKKSREIVPVPTELSIKKKTPAQVAEVIEEELKPVSDMKSAWERRQLAEAEERARRLELRRTARSPLPREDIVRLQNKLGDVLLSPEILEKKQVRGTTVSALKAVRNAETPEQTKRATECAEQRTSFASYRDRLKPAPVRDDENKKLPSAKSDYGGYRMPSSTMNSVLSRFNRQTPYESQDACLETKSDVGSAPTFARVKLRSTGGVVKHDEQRHHSESPYQGNRSLEDNESFVDDYENYGDEGSLYSDDELEWMRQQEGHEFDSEDSGEPSPRKMTYREKRELELKVEREKKEAEEKAKKQPERDVAALIRRRIAANKRAAVQAERKKNEKKEDISGMRNVLRKVSVEGNESPLPRTPSRSSAYSEKSPDFTVERLKKATVTIDSPQRLGPSTDLQNAAIHPRVGWNEVTEESASPVQQPVSIVSSEVDTVSTSRSNPEHPSSLHEMRQPASRVPLERAKQSEGARHEPSHGAEDKASHRSRVSAVQVEQSSIQTSSESTKSVLNALFAQRLPPPPSLAPSPSSAPAPQSAAGSPLPMATPLRRDETTAALMKMHFQQDARKLDEDAPPKAEASPCTRPALKDDAKYDRYFRMLKVGMPMDVVKHAMARDGIDPSVMDGDHNQPAGGMSLKEDPKYARYFKMLSVGLPMGAVKNAMQRDGLDPSVMDGDHNLPPGGGVGDASDDEHEEAKVKDTHRRARLHWETLRQVKSTSLWANIDQDSELEQIDIDEEEFQLLFQAELTPAQSTNARAGVPGKRKGAAVRVIESKRANNGGIILARLKMTHDDMAEAVDRIDENALTAEQMQNIIEYLPTSEERKALEGYMLERGEDAAEKFEGLCETEKFMVSMMTVRHAKRKVRALLFKLQFDSCLGELEKDATLVESACDELSNSVRLRKLLGIVLNIGNRLNTAGSTGKRKAGAFSLNSLLKLSHAKAFDKKTTFLHYVVLVVQRNNELLLNFKDDIPSVFKADKVFWDQVLIDLEEVENQLENVRRIALHQARLALTCRMKKKKQKSEDDDAQSLSDESMTLEEEVEMLRSSSIGLFTLGAIKKVSALRDKVESTKMKFAKLLEYFGEDDKRQRMQPHELFSVMTKFCRDFDKAKEHVLADEKKKQREERKRQASNSAANGKQLPPPNSSLLSTQRSPRPSPKSDAGVKYTYPTGSKQRTEVRRSETSHGSNSSSTQQRPEAQRPQKSQLSNSSSMKQHISTVNGMYESPKDLGTRKSRSSTSVPQDRERSLRDRARMRRLMGQGKSSNSSPSVSSSFGNTAIRDASIH